MNQNENNFNNFNQYESQNYSAPQPNVQIKNTKSKFWTFIFALIPGAGQMYQGLTKKGISVMTLFFGIIAVSLLLYIPVINLVLPIIWFYSFFDVFNRMSYSVDELKAVDDGYIFNLNDNDLSLKLKKHFLNKNLLIGWVIIIVGIYALLNALVFGNLITSDIFFGGYVYEIMYYILNITPKLIIPVVCILIGFKLIKGNNKNKKVISEEKIHEDIV